MQAKYFIALCDILGFSELVKRNELDVVIHHSLGWFLKALYHSLHKSGFPNEVPLTEALKNHPNVGVAWFSDTVLFYTKEDENAAIRELLSTVAWLVFETMLEGQTRVRAGIAYGEVYIDPVNSLFVGRPIVDAYKLEQQQEWSGAALTPTAVERLPLAARTGQYADWWLVAHDIPFKGGRTQQTLAINWNIIPHHPSWRLRWSQERDLPSESDWKDEEMEEMEERGSICEKFVNTKAFHELHCPVCRDKGGT